MGNLSSNNYTDSFKRRTTAFFLIAAVFLGGLLFSACDTTAEEEGGIVTLEGQVLNQETDNPLSEAFVQILPMDLLVETDEQGKFLVDVEIDSTMNLNLTASKDGFRSETVTILALAGRIITVPTFRLLQLKEEGPESGRAASILLLGQEDEAIGVKESGSKEVTEIIFQAVDSLGRPITLDNAINISFQLGERPNGGEYIFPEVGETDNQGRVAVNLASGTIAGVVQILAEAVVDGRTIRSLPVVIAIHGGLPDQAHFTLGPERFNFPGLRWFNITDRITVLVGDKYSNPVRPGTAVYFSTTHGVIEGSTNTNNQGSGSVNLISGNPLPPDGIAVVTASTADENEVQVWDQTPVVFSGVPWIRVTPATAIFEATYSLTVTDQNGNPLVEGTSITVRAGGTNVKAVGNTAVQLDDTAFLGGLTYDNVLRGPGITEFTFRVVTANDELVSGLAPLPPELETVTIRVSGENGDLEIVLTPGAAPKTMTDGATIEMIGGDEVIIKGAMD
jgi:hypothetical protein